MTTDVEALSTIADYQFGAGAGEALFAGEIQIQRTSSGRPQQILADGDRVVSYGVDGRSSNGATASCARSGGPSSRRTRWRISTPGWP